MNWTPILAVLALVCVQMGFVGACLYAYTRIKSQQDSGGQERMQWGIEVKAAVTQADTARKMAEAIETQHFRSLRALVEGYAAELSDARARIVSLEKELKVCQMKLASEDRIARREEQRRAERASQAVPAALGEAEADSLADLPGVIPLRQPAAPAAATAPVKSNFGRAAHR